MKFYLLIVLLEALTFISDPFLKKNTSLPDKSILLLNQGAVFFLASFAPLFGVNFQDIKTGAVLVDGKIVWVLLIFGLTLIFIAFFIICRNRMMR